jgi:hypothetical protein
MVQTAASIAQAESTAFPPLIKVIAPTVAASGLPVIATQCFPWSTGFSVRRGKRGTLFCAGRTRAIKNIIAAVKIPDFIFGSSFHLQRVDQV